MMTKERICSLFASVMFTMAAFTVAADKVDQISGEYTYYGALDESPAQCRKKAEEGAIAAALQAKYGSTVTQNIQQSETIKGDRQSSDFLMLSSAEVNGQWLGHSEDPKFEVEMMADGALVVRAKVKGKASKISNDNTQFEAVLMKNGTDPQRNAGTDFLHGDEFYMYFSAPTDGYLSVFLADEQKNVYCIFPYPSSGSAQAKTKGKFQYVFFNPATGDNQYQVYGRVTPYYMTADNGMEYNKVYVVFSPQPYSLPNLKYSQQSAIHQLPPDVGYEDFTKWLSKLRATDSKIGVKQMNISVRPK